MSATGRPSSPRTWIWFSVLCAVCYVITAPGRITFPDDEIVFQTTEAIYERGALDIEGIRKRTGERAERPSGTFGWAPGTDQERYGFFGHGLSLAALPLYGLGVASFRHVPEAWTHAPRRDLFAFHDHSARGDWLRLMVSLTNGWVTVLAAWLLVRWGLALGLGRRACVLTGLAYALGTSAWPYAGTFLSEPLSAACLVGAAWRIAVWHRDREPTALWGAGAIAGFCVHVHLLNLLALPCLLGYALAPVWRSGVSSHERRALLGALLLAGLGLVALASSHWLRFGSPFESGRYDHYGHFTWPWEGMVAQLFAPGRSLWLYSPALVFAVLGWPALRRKLPAAAWFVLAIVAVRWLFVSARSDWYGGWGIGPRYLVAILPLAMLPLAVVADRWLEGTPGRRRALVAALVGCVAFEGWLAAHSMFEHMWDLMMRHGVHDYFHASHWDPAASPIVVFARFDAAALAELLHGGFRSAVAIARLDTLAFGAVRLALVGHTSLLWALAGLVPLGAVAAVRLRAALDSDPKA